MGKNETLRQRRRGNNENDRWTNVKANEPLATTSSQSSSTSIIASPLPSTATATTTTNPSSHSIMSVIKKHPLTYLILLVGIPYFIWVGYRWILLQHPLYPTWRPAVQLSDPRQVLILGTMSSGTSSIVHYLSQIPNLEIGHEDSDTSWKFVRDGTVSWFHGIRYWNVMSDSTSTSFGTKTLMDEQRQLQQQNEEEQRHKVIVQLCKVQWMMHSLNSLNDNYGFGPTLFGTPEYNCSWWQQAPSIPMSCYRHACEKALQREFACAIVPARTDDRSTIGTALKSTCATPYQTTLVQTREPWKIVTSLTAKYCLDTTKATATNTSLHFREYLPKTLFWLFLALQIPSNTCVVQLIDYVVLYYRNVAHLPRYKIESLPSNDPLLAACHVLQMAGLDQRNTTVYPPNHDLYRTKCVLEPQRRLEQVKQQNQQQVSSSRSSSSSSSMQASVKKNVINQGRVRLEDILPLVPDEFIVKMKQLYQLLEYEYPA